MPSESDLLGHFEALAWRPLQFVALPPAISCDLCAVIPEKIFRLECFHFLCEGCYQSVLQSDRRCPLDKQGFLGTEVQTSLILTTHLQKLEVRCCNFNRGCTFVGSLERMKSHYLNDCGFHSLTCRKCCATVLSKDIISHYMEEECRAQNGPREDVDIDSSVVGIGREINASLSDIADKLRAVEDQLNSHAVGIDTTKECVDNYAQVLRTIQEEHRLSTEGVSNLASTLHTVTEALSSIEEHFSNEVGRGADVQNIVTSNRERLTALIELQKEVAQNVVTFCGGWKQSSEKFEEMSKRMPDHFSSTDNILSTTKDILQTLRDANGYGHNVAFFHVQDVDELKKKANEKGFATSYSDVFALCGFSVKLCVEFRQYDDVMCISAGMCICRGTKSPGCKSSFTCWYTLTLMHPTNDKMNICECANVPNVLERFLERFNRPVQSSDMGVRTSRFCKLEDALNAGFVHKNSITFGLTVTTAVKPRFTNTLRFSENRS
ncbi:TNF receptor-associated factor 3-like [Ornithodoros turicata]|uniref:TNF receptor-associated factor 3-like n=1 Tax=Ornithodoros turicata TaxID=34597 RepID=UPI0031394A9E